MLATILYNESKPNCLGRQGQETDTLLIPIMLGYNKRLK